MWLAGPSVAGPSCRRQMCHQPLASRAPASGGLGMPSGGNDESARRLVCACASCLERTRRDSNPRVPSTAREGLSGSTGDVPSLLPYWVRVPQNTIAASPASSGRACWLTPDEWPVIHARIRNGKTLRALAAEYGVSHETIRRVHRASQPTRAHPRHALNLGPKARRHASSQHGTDTNLHTARWHMLHTERIDVPCRVRPASPAVSARLSS